MKIRKVLVSSVVALSLAACQPAVQSQTPSAAPSTPAPTAVSPSPTPTAVPTPTPTYPPGTEQAVSALENYFEVWDAWAQKPTRDWDHVLNLTTDEAQVKAQLVMTDRLEASVAVIGRPVYRNWQVGAVVSEPGHRPQVTIVLCQDLRGTKRTDKDGKIYDNDARGLEYYQMRRQANGKWLLGDWTNEAQPC